MKTVVKSVFLTLCFALIMAFAFSASTHVWAKMKVTCKVKKGTLTIKGKGNMPKKLKIKKKTKNKIKKVVIKKGVKSISNNAFMSFKKLSKVSISSTVKKIGTKAFYNTSIKSLKIPSKTLKLGEGFVDNCKKLETITLPGNFNIVDSKGNKIKRKSTKKTDLINVNFNSNLNYKVTSYFKTLNYNTYEKDPEFKSFDGVIYTKDGKSLVRVPSARDILAIRNGCTDFNTYSVLYSPEGNNFPSCSELVKIIIPKTLVRISETNYADDKLTNNYAYIDVIMDDTKLSIPEIVKLKNRFEINPENLIKKLPARVTKTDDFIVGDSKYLISGNQNTVVNVPDGIETIYDKAFWGKNNNIIILPSSVENIDDYAFENSSLIKINLENVKSIGEGAFKGTQINSIELPASITSVPKFLFKDCLYLENIEFKGNVNSIGEKAFYNTKININDFLHKNKKIQTIRKGAFGEVSYTNISIPSNIVTIEQGAFKVSNILKYVSLDGITKNYDFNSFGCEGDVTLRFNKGISEAFTSQKHKIEKTSKYVKYNIYWNKVSEVSGYDIWISKNKTFNNRVKKYSAKYNLKSINIKLKKKKAKGLKYIGIRPYKIVNGKKVYGRWNITEL